MKHSFVNPKLTACAAAVLLCCSVLFIQSNARAQGCPPNPNCPPDDGLGCWIENNTLWSPSPGCELYIDYCWREVNIGGTITEEYYLHSIGVKSGCDGISIGTLMGEVASQLYQALSTVPECGIVPGQLVSIINNSCWEYNPMWGVNGHPELKVYTGCGTGTCTKTCSICFGYSLACSCYEDQISDCTYDEEYSSGSCTEGAPTMDQWVAYTCYHLPCSW